SPAQLLEMRDRPERAPEVRGEHPNVGALRALEREVERVAAARRELQTADLDLARRALHGDAAAGRLVERDASALERRGQARHLLLRSHEAPRPLVPRRGRPRPPPPPPPHP